jgi:hypothetical protein
MILKCSIDQRFFNAKKTTNLLDIEPLLMVKNWDLSLYIFRDGVEWHVWDDITSEKKNILGLQPNCGK